MGYLIEPPQKIEGDFVAIFAQVDLADQLAVAFLRDRGFEARVFPIAGDLGSSFGAMGGGDLFGGEALVCVPSPQADEAQDALYFDSGLVEDGGEDDEDAQ